MFRDDQRQEAPANPFQIFTPQEEIRFALTLSATAAVIIGIGAAFFL